MKKIILLLPIILSFSGCYVLRQASFFLDYNGRAVNNEKLLEDENIPDKTKEFLSLITEIKGFAIEVIGLKSDKNYTKYVDLEKDYIADVVSAAAPDSFEPYTWWFPVIGSVPYKGFYVKDEAVKESGKLKKKGYDVYVREVDAFSSLGFFIDPLYSFMEDYSLFNIASLIIHEQTHATIFLKNEVQFNEELAMFIGNKGALLYIKEKYGEDSAAYKEAVGGMADADVFQILLEKLYAELRILYNSKMDTDSMMEKKREIIERHQRRFEAEYESNFQTENYKAFADLDVNNAWLSTWMLYTKDLSIFDELYEKCGGDLSAVINKLMILKDYKEDPKEYIRDVLIN